MSREIIVSGQDIVARSIVEKTLGGEEPFPEDPGERFNRVFAALGNSAAKCTTILCLSTELQTASDILRRFVTVSSRVWIPAKKNFKEYCQQTLIPIGLVAEEVFTRQETDELVAGFRLKDAGVRYGQPIAAFLLARSAEIGYSLGRIFGNTGTSGETRGVTNRAAILEALASNSTPRRTIDIAISSGLSNQVVSGNLRHFAELGLVSYSSASPEKPGFVKYQLVSGAQKHNVKPTQRNTTISREIADLLFKYGRVDVTTLMEPLQKLHSSRSPRSLASEISRSLSDLEKQGICRHELYKGGRKDSIFSQAAITEKGRMIAEEIILPIREALSDSIEGNRLLTEWSQIPWWEYARTAIQKHKESSGHVNRYPIEEWVLKALAIIRENPGIRPTNLKTALGRETNTILRALVDQRLVVKKSDGMAVRYYAQGEIVQQPVWIADYMSANSKGNYTTYDVFRATERLISQSKSAQDVRDLVETRAKEFNISPDQYGIYHLPESLFVRLCEEVGRVGERKKQN